MDEAESSPASNRLGAGVTDETLRQAVEHSGYPLQTIVAAKVGSADFAIREEWVFTDSDTGQLRALDIYASRPLYDRQGHSNPRVRPSVSLLIECKRSEMPYIFFASDSRPGRGGFAVSVAGLHQDEISVRTDDGMSTWSFTTLRALGLADHTFVADPPRVAMTFSKAARRGKELELSGTDPYQSLVLPLTKALRGYTGRIAPPKTAMYFDVVLPLAVAVIDGPMVVASVSQSGVSYELHPWVRVYRHDVDMAAARRFEREKLHAIDCVHSDWLEEYLLQHLNPFAEEFGRRSLVHDHEIATGSAFAEGMNRDSWSDLHHRLRPVRFSDRSRRPKTFIEGLRSAAEEAWPGRRRS